MKYIKKFENNSYIPTKPGKYYWGLPNDKYYFKKKLEKIGCPDYRIQQLIDNIKLFDPDEVSTIFICLNSLLKPQVWHYSQFGSVMIKNGFEYLGVIPLSKEEIREVKMDIEKDKYNL